MTTCRKKPVLVDAWQYAPEGVDSQDEYDRLVLAIGDIYMEELGVHLYGFDLSRDDETGEVSFVFEQVPTVLEPTMYVVRENENRWYTLSAEQVQEMLESVPEKRPNFIQSI